VSGLAHYFEDEGLSTVVVALVREHVVKMRPPRALWVPFEMGRPFGTPNDIGLQHRVLEATLALLDQPGPGPFLEDFTEEAPYPDGDADWQAPGGLAKNSVSAEAQSLLSFWQLAQDRFGKTTVGVSGLTPETAVEFVERFHSDNPMQIPKAMAKGMAKVSRARFAVDDIKAFYFEAAAVALGNPSSLQINDWFWNNTLAGKMILEFQDAVRVSDEKNLRLIESSLVPPERTFEYLNRSQ